MVHQNTGSLMLIFTNAVMLPGAKTSYSMGSVLGNVSTISFEMKIFICVQCYQEHYMNFINYYIYP